MAILYLGYRLSFAVEASASAAAAGIIAAAAIVVVDIATDLTAPLRAISLCHSHLNVIVCPI